MANRDKIISTLTTSGSMCDDCLSFSSMVKPRQSVELKFPRNGQHPEQMFSFCKDVVFTEQLKKSGFNKAYAIIFAEDRLFYEGVA